MPSALKQELAAAEVPDEPPPATTVSTDLPPDPALTCTVTGRVLSQNDHRPLAGVRVIGETVPRKRRKNPVRTEVRSDEEGRYVLNGLTPGEFRVYACGIDYVSPYLNTWTSREFGPEPIELLAGSETRLDLEVVKTGRLQVRVVAQDGSTETKFILCATAAGGTTFDSIILMTRFVGDRSIIRGLVPGLAYQIRSEPARLQLEKPVVVKSGETVVVQIDEIPNTEPSRPFSLRILGPDGRPVKRASYRTHRKRRRSTPRARPARQRAHRAKTQL